MRPTPLSAWALAALSLAPPAPLAQEARKEAGTDKISLRLNVREGDRFGYRYVVDQDQSTNVGPMDVGSRLHNEMEMTYVVEEVAGDGSAWIEVRFVNVKGTTTLPMGGEIAFDSTKPDENADPTPSRMTKPFTALAGKSIRMRLAPNGRVLELRGMSEILADMKRALFEEDEGAAEMFASMMEATFSAEAMTRMMQTCVAAFPDAPVSLGASWKAECAFPMSGFGLDLALQQISTVEKFDAETATIESVGEMSMSASAGPATKPEQKKKEGEEDDPSIRKKSWKDLMEGVKGRMSDLQFEKGGLRATQSMSRRDGLPLRIVTEWSFEIGLADPTGEEKDAARTRMTMKMVIERTSLTTQEPASRPAARR
ncbi:MAG TPA: DUF6263 family protein [Planctomycetota bacterium]|jgi:hypothetical protein|nr:DUF6263 family protein [Planctomycetota bacterium]